MFKNKSILIYVFFILFFLLACWDNDEEILIEPIGKLKYTLAIDQKSFDWLYSYYKYDADTLLVKIQYKDEVKELGERIFEYNNRRQLIREIQSGPYLTYKVINYIYDEEGKLIEDHYYIFKYDSIDRLIEKKVIKSNQLYEYEYDSLFKNRIKYEKYYLESHEEPVLVYSNEYKYNESNNLYEIYLESENWLYESGILESLEYNSKNQLEKKVIYNRKLHPYIETEISYYYY